MPKQNCPKCTSSMTPASIAGGGRIGWFCVGCDVFVPDGDYIEVRDPPIEAPL